MLVPGGGGGLYARGMKGRIVTLFALVAVACAPTEDVGFTSVTSGETGTGETGGTGDPDPNCADPEFGEKVPEDPTISECVGQGGGAIAFDMFSGFGNGVVPDQSVANPTVFFPEDVAVGACCGVAATPLEIGGACESDCGRAACNMAISTLQDAVADPASLEGKGCGESCAKHAASSLQDWVLPQLASSTGYADCVTMAASNSDPNLDYGSAGFTGDELGFQRPEGACMKFGCLSNVRLRVYCAVESVTATDQMCMMATNDVDPDIPESGRFTLAAALAEVTSGPKDRPKTLLATSNGGVLRQDVCDDPACPLVLESFSLSTNETVEIGPLHARNLTATLAYAAIGARVGDAVTFDAGALQFRISGVASEDTTNGEDIELPLEFVIVNTSPAFATFTGTTFSVDELEFRQGHDELRFRIHAAPATAIE